MCGTLLASRWPLTPASPQGLEERIAWLANSGVANGPTNLRLRSTFPLGSSCRWRHAFCLAPPHFTFLGVAGGDTRYRARPDLFHHCPGPGAKSVKGSVSAVKPKPDSPGLVLSFDLHPPDPSVISNGAELSRRKTKGALGVVIERPAVSNPNAFYIMCPINGSC